MCRKIYFLDLNQPCTLEAEPESYPNQEGKESTFLLLCGTALFSTGSPGFYFPAMHIVGQFPHGACTLSENNAMLIKPVPMYVCFIWPEASAFGFNKLLLQTTSSPGLGADECRPVILGVGGICLKLLVRPTLFRGAVNYLALLFVLPMNAFPW